MKYELETIPVWDAYQENSECPLCLLWKKAEKGYVEFFLGNSVMVPETRVEVNKTGFCAEHFEALFLRGEHRQHLGLLTHTRFLYLRERTSALLRDRDFMGKRGSKKRAEKIREELSRCMICRRLEERLKRYVFTILYHWKKDDEFRGAYGDSRGFCFPHLAEVLDMAETVLKGDLLNEWREETRKVQEREWSRLEEEIHWYTQKFEFTNSGKPWGNSRDALERGIQKMIGRPVGEEKR